MYSVDHKSSYTFKNECYCYTEYYFAILSFSIDCVMNPWLCFDLGFYQLIPTWLLPWTVKSSMVQLLGC